MRVVSSSGGVIVVEHVDGYVFTFEIHDIDGLTMDLVSVAWPIVGPPPDADDLEMRARALAETEARDQGWL